MAFLFIAIGIMLTLVVILLILMAIDTKKDLQKLNKSLDNQNSGIDYSSPLLTRMCGMNKD